MRYPFSAQDVSEAVQGRIIYGDGARSISTYCIDSRFARKETLFIPLLGTQRDGHNFILDAISRGASACLVRSKHPKVKEIVSALSEAQGGRLPESAKSCAIIEVRHTLVALQKLAGWFRRNFSSVKICGITGSVGKTQTKEMAVAMLRSKFATVCTEKNFNNEIGVPLALGKLTPKVEVAVLEMAMRGRGEISLLSRLAQPDISIITNTHSSHIGRLGSLSEISKAKSEIVDGMKPDGTIWLNLTDASLPTILNEIKEKSANEAHFKTKFFDVSAVDAEVKEFFALSVSLGQDTPLTNTPIPAKPDLLVKDVKLNGIKGSSFTLSDLKRSYRVTLKALGSSAIKNFTCACAVCKDLGLSLEECVGLSESLKPTPQRLKPYELREDVYLIDDSYNSSPASACEALSLLSQLPLGWKRIIVFGDMLELGRYETLLHRQVTQLAYSLPPSKILCIGKRSKAFLEVPTPDGFEVVHFPGIEGTLVSNGNFEPLEAGPNPPSGTTDLGASASNSHVEVADDETIARVNDILLEEVKNQSGPAVILIKGSRAIHLERVVQTLLGQFGYVEAIL